MVIVLALCAALGYGVSDFAGGVAARRFAPTVVLLGGGLTGALVIAVLLPLRSGSLTWSAGCCAAAAGACGLVGLGLMYRLMTTAPLSTVSPVTAVLAAATPLVCGSLQGDRPSPAGWLGMLLALTAVGFLGAAGASGGGVRGGRLDPRALLTAVGSGVGFGGYFVLTAHAAHSAAVLPVLLVGKLASIVLVTPFAIRALRADAREGRPRKPGCRPGTAAIAALAAVGLTDAVADVSFLFATRTGQLSVAGVIASLYPAVTVVLAVVVLHERTGWRPRIALGLSVLSLALIAS